MNASSPKLRFFVDPLWRREGLSPAPLMFPFWGNPPTPKMPFFHELFERHGFDAALYEITNEAAADLVFMPYSYATARRLYPELFARVSEKARALNLPLVVDGSGDVDWDIPGEHVIVLRHGGYRFSKRPGDIAIPFYAGDLLEAYCGGKLDIRAKAETPSISFAGWASISMGQEVRAIIKELPDRFRALFNSNFAAKKKGIFFRREAARAIRKSPRVRAHFILRTSYSGHTDTAQKSPDELRREFVENMLTSDYCLDVRGDANNSIRLFEILSLGRVPVIVDTERNLPFADKLDYSEFSLIVDFRDIQTLPDIVADFNARISDEQFAAMQQKAREAYVKYFRVDAMTPHIMREIRARLSL